MAKPDRLEAEISEARLTITSDGYPMSIGELTNLYKEGELKIRPEFQRFFRWSPLQKSHLIESILLGIPLPSIFVAQGKDGIWELVDGLQRVSTILQVQGELRDRDGSLLPPFTLEGTKYLPALEGRCWNGPSKIALPEALKLDIKRSKIDIKIIKRDSSPQAKFDLFQRLNNFGTPLSAQEMRSALLVSVSPDFFSWVESLSTDPAFLECTQLSEKLVEERFDVELVIRFLVLHNWPSEKLTLSMLRDLPQVLDDEAATLAFKFPKGVDALTHTFKETFAHIAEHGGDSVFRRWSADKEEFRGSFLSTSFEVFGLGLGYHIANRSPYRRDLLPQVEKFWSRPEMQKGFATGKSTEARLVQFIPEGRKITGA
ncbi:DUF262 domain-containing protein [Reyranella sp.]|uniref:DUF262 domain-containing protein n=1 Tax=Reyranella sp. TaxID=1929291 RepID=UPI002731EF2F|nr:DUF262 domain-containing protein [Reyranella sp.]MDP2373803.1 DUF262 domain-containing protein [Reyranella sp.]